MALQKIQPSYKFNEEQLTQLRQIAPEAFKDNILDFNTLYEALSDSLEDDDFQTEHFGLVWPGKTDAKKMAAVPSKGSLIPVVGEGINEAVTRNVFIEGDNLEVLKIIKKAYANKIKMIYIDPPYNTGNDFIYDDDFTESIEGYMQRTKQINEQGIKLTSNIKTSGRFHSKWLSMMYPRLKLAWSLLKDDGVLFISIDDNEVFNLRTILNEIFGEENFIAEFIWKSRQNKDNRNVTGVSIDHEYILCYSKTNDQKRIRGSLRKLDQYKNPDNDPRGPWASGNMVGLLPEKLRPNCHYDLINPFTGINYGKPKMGWRYDKKTMSTLIQENRILWPNTQDGRPRKKVFLNELQDNFTGLSSIVGIDVYTKDGSSEVEELFGFKAFDFPKPTALIKEFIQQGCDSEDYIMDFFAGSSTTGHSVWLQNLEDKIFRKFILIQIPEQIDPKAIAYEHNYKTISKLSFERLRKASNKLLNESGSDGIDLGALYYRYENSNFKVWQNYDGTNAKQLETLFSQHESSLVDDWKPENLLTEILLIEGFPLDSKVEAAEAFKKNKVQKVTSDFCEHSLFVCLDEKVEDETIKALILGDNDIFICLDNAVTDQDKARLDDKGLIKTI